MRFVRGRTLDEASREFHRRRRAGEEEPLALVALLSAFVTICNTVAYAHSKGVIHRDLKGENVLLGDFGEVFILDWGVAKVLDAPEDAGNDQLAIQTPATDGCRTIHGSIVGTPAYMAPEQAEGRQDLVDCRSDIYGLGAVLYEILTGQPPFAGSSTVEILEKVLRDAPIPPRRLWPEAPAGLEAACLRALSKDPAGRHPSAAALGQEVQNLAGNAAPPGRGRPPPQPRAIRAGRPRLAGRAVGLGPARRRGLLLAAVEEHYRIRRPRTRQPA